MRIDTAFSYLRVVNQLRSDDSEMNLTHSEMADLHR